MPLYLFRGGKMYKRRINVCFLGNILYIFYNPYFRAMEGSGNLYKM